MKQSCSVIAVADVVYWSATFDDRASCCRFRIRVLRNAGYLVRLMLFTKVVWCFVVACVDSHVYGTRYSAKFTAENTISLAYMSRLSSVKASFGMSYFLYAICHELLLTRANLRVKVFRFYLTSTSLLEHHHHHHHLPPPSPTPMTCHTRACVYQHMPRKPNAPNILSAGLVVCRRKELHPRRLQKDGQEIRQKLAKSRPPHAEKAGGRPV